ncbi:hypothetical protein B9J88_11860 [Vibrio sp. V05_P4A8T149]|nr:hypothetical protein B9J86_11965 [Vibrio sp. V06_P1A73T115]OXX21346.1 hypothetical protein B9J88_11860 [Vibrio sp. V05_P4A8T149]OXX30797.1 hypothetical protein B9J81_15305 [Vibrio sp. V04_P4A5T148]OXX33192.1 hypothetical protein B9J95_05995 [Vibrio sp. V14_P6S14T42]OXX52047.1 hypothetical protein B9J91_16095 [Vibrio sp. V18_P1S4T112]
MIFSLLTHTLWFISLSQQEQPPPSLPLKGGGTKVVLTSPEKGEVLRCCSPPLKKRGTKIMLASPKRRGTKMMNSLHSRAILGTLPLFPPLIGEG